MRTPNFVIAALLAPACLAARLSGAFVGIECVPFVGSGWEDHGYAGLATYRVYAVFDDSGPEQDGVVFVYGLEGAPLSVQSSDGMFHNDALNDALVEPEDLRPQGVWSNQWDTYVTIGWWNAIPGENTQLSPNFAAETNDLATDWTTENALWSILPCDGNFCPGRTNGASRILLMQLTVAEGESVSGIVNFGGPVDLVEGLAFSSVTPCPADVDGNGVVDRDDVARVLAAWGSCDACPEDVDGSGGVGFEDLLAVLLAWGACP